MPGLLEGLWARFPRSARRSCSVRELLPWLDLGARAVVGREVRGFCCVDRSSSWARRSSGAAFFDIL